MNHDSIQVPASISDTLKHHHLISGYGSRLTGAARHRPAPPRLERSASFVWICAGTRSPHRLRTVTGSPRSRCVHARTSSGPLDDGSPSARSLRANREPATRGSRECGAAPSDGPSFPVSLSNATRRRGGARRTPGGSSSDRNVPGARQATRARRAARAARRWWARCWAPRRRRSCWRRRGRRAPCAAGAARARWRRARRCWRARRRCWRAAAARRARAARARCTARARRWRAWPGWRCARARRAACRRCWAPWLWVRARPECGAARGARAPD